MKFVLFLFIALAFAGCIANEEIMPPEVGIKRMKLTTGQDNFTGPSNVIDWTTQNWLLGEEPPTWNQQFDQSVRILSVHANVTYDFPNQVVGGGVRTELTSWHGVGIAGQNFMTSHRFFGHDAQTNSKVTAYFDMEMPLGGLYVPVSDSYAFAIGHYYTDGIGPNAPTAKAILDIRYEYAELPAIESGDAITVNLLGGLCLAPADVDAQREIPLSASNLTALAVSIKGNNDALGDVDFFVTWNGQRIMHGASPGNTEYVVLGPAGLAMIPEGDDLTLTIFNCHPQASTVQVQVHGAQA